ncbi:hypothetical protein [Virgibacillus profundi]|nr:hypothetical protein [Virgibacillus profundi]
MDIHKLFKEKESDKISREIASKIYPVDPLQEQFKYRNKKI